MLSALAWLGWTLMTRHTGNAPTTGTGSNTSSVTVGTLQAPESLDIRTVKGHAVEQALLGNVYETLIGRDADNHLAPGLAQRWEVSSDGLVYTLHLIPGAVFSNGRTLDASDAVWSLQQAADHHYIGADGLTGVSSVTDPDAHTLRLTLTSPKPELLRLLAGRLGIVYSRDAPGDHATQALGSGPFTVASWKPGSELTLRRNPSYWGQDKAKVNTVRLHYLGDATSLAEAFASGDVDVATPLETSETATLKRRSGAKVETGAGAGKVILGFNNGTDSIFSDKRYRQGIRYAIGNAALIKAIGVDGRAIGGPIAPIEPGYEDLTGLFPHDTTRATDLLAYFFYRTKLRELSLVYPQRYGTAVGQAIRSALQPMNVDLQVHMVSDAQWQTAVVDQHRYDLTIFQMDGQADGISDMATLVNTDYFIGYTSPQAEQLIGQARTRTDDDAYVNALHAAARQMSDDSPVDWLYAQTPLTAHRSGISGVPVNLTDRLLPLGQLSLAR